jgi:hypothetical protein
MLNTTSSNNFISAPNSISCQHQLIPSPAQGEGEVGVERRIVLRDSTHPILPPPRGKGWKRTCYFKYTAYDHKSFFLIPAPYPLPEGEGEKKKRLSRRELGAKGGIYDRGQYIFD